MTVEERTGPLPIELIRGCRSCGSPEITTILSLGSTPLANRLLAREQLAEPEPVYPLSLAFCPRCTLVQLRETVPPEVLFREYLYFSSFSDTMLRHAEDLVSKLIAERGLNAESLAVEIASNDGYLLQYFVRAGIPVLGVEPAVNVAAVAEVKGIRTVTPFFGAETARELRAAGEAADVIIGINVLGHVADLNGVVQGLKTLLKPNGVVVIEVPYVRDMIEHSEFDTIYHEHLHYFSVTALDHLFTRHGLRLTDVERLPIHGGTIRVSAMHAEAAPARPNVERSLREEADWGVGELDYYAAFAGRVGALRRALRQIVGEFKAGGRRLAAYGAAAKGNTLLAYCGIGAAELDFVVDRSTYKQDRYMPGNHLPILPPEALLERMPDAVLLLTWNFAEEIMRQQAEYLRRGGRFIVPVPAPRVVTA